MSLTDRDLLDAERLLRTLLEASESNASKAPGEAAPQDRKAFVEAARQTLQRRRKRAMRFGSGMFGEPAWDILLILYSEASKERLPVSRLVTASGSPATTGLRWLEYLETQQLVCRKEHPTDRRVDLIELTEKGRANLDLYFSDTLAKER